MRRVENALERSRRHVVPLTDDPLRKRSFEPVQASHFSVGFQLVWVSVLFPLFRSSGPCWTGRGVVFWGHHFLETFRWIHEHQLEQIGDPADLPSRRKFAPRQFSFVTDID